MLSATSSNFLWLHFFLMVILFNFFFSLFFTRIKSLWCMVTISQTMSLFYGFYCLWSGDLRDNTWFVAYEFEQWVQHNTEHIHSPLRKPAAELSWAGYSHVRQNPRKSFTILQIIIIYNPLFFCIDCLCHRSQKKKKKNEWTISSHVVACVGVTVEQILP